jgi:hypothetical protein
LGSVAIEYAAKRRYLDRQVAVLDDGAGPHGGNDLILRDDLSRPPDQYPENVEPARADRHRDKGAVGITPEQTSGAPVEAEVFEQENLRRRERLHDGAVSLWPPRPRGETRLCLPFEFLEGGFCRISEKFGSFYRRFVACPRPPIILTALSTQGNPGGST